MNLLPHEGAAVRRRIPVRKSGWLRSLGTWLAAACLLSSIWPPGTASAVEVTIPLNIDYFTLAEAFKQQAYDGPDGRAVLWTGSDKCQYLYAYHPRFQRKDGALILGTDADLSLGVAVAGKCITPITWSGIIETETQPYIGADLAIKFHVTDVNLYNPAHEKTVLLRGFDLIKGHFVPKIEDFSYDLREPLRQLEDLMQAAAAPDVIDRVKTAIATMRPLSGVVPGDDGLQLTLELDVPEVPAPEPSVAPAALTPAEIAAFQTMLDDWDAFIVFAIKQLAGTVGDKQSRAQLFNLLLDSRYRLVAALSEPQASAGPDPIRLVFIDEWTRLRSIIQSAARRELLGSRALQFLSFVTAGDALFAVDQAAPALGMRISEDDLRRLAHMMAPQYAADPLAFSYDTDPELQQLFGFSPPLESPGPIDATVPEITPSATPTGTPTVSPMPPSPSPGGSLMSPSPTPVVSPMSPSPSPAASLMSPSPTPAGSNAPAAGPSATSTSVSGMPTGASATPATSSGTPGGSGAPSTVPTSTPTNLIATPTSSSPTSAGSNAPAAAPTATATSISGTPEGSNITPTPTPIEPSPGDTVSPTAMRSWFRWLAPRDANASEEPASNEIFRLGAALKRVVVEDDNASAYTRSIQRLLTLIAQQEIINENSQPQYRQTYLILVKSTAWQESCWRQFIRVNGQVRFLESATADVGLMQVNRHVWRGFYSIPRLEWDIVYNAGAGAEILMRLMSSDTSRTIGNRRYSMAEVARSTYAAYNGGPNAYNRWRTPDEEAVEVRYIDESFWTKFRNVSAGHLFDILSCAATWGRTPIAVQRASPH
jgi:hypothetical protein